MDFTIHRIPAFHDNYLWLLADSAGSAVVVDPGDAEPVIETLASHGLTLAAILATHHHPDHVGGVDQLLARFHCPVYGPRSPTIPQVDHPLREGDSFTLLGASFTVLEVPGHTLDHIVYYSEDLAETPVLFAGDTLFAGGCGRLFEGTPDQMQASLAKIARLPGDTAVYCAHEYTQANLNFAAAVEPNNAAVANRLAEVAELRRRNVATVPTRLSLEMSTNPFLRWDEAPVIRAAEQKLGRAPTSAAETFAAIRSWKDNF